MAAKINIIVINVMAGKSLNIIHLIIDQNLVLPVLVVIRVELVLIIILIKKKESYPLIYNPDYLDLHQEIGLSKIYIKILLKWFPNIQAKIIIKTNKKISQGTLIKLIEIPKCN